MISAGRNRAKCGQSLTVCARSWSCVAESGPKVAQGKCEQLVRCGRRLPNCGPHRPSLAGRRIRNHFASSHSTRTKATCLATFEHLWKYRNISGPLCLCTRADQAKVGSGVSGSVRIGGEMAETSVHSSWRAGTDPEIRGRQRGRSRGKGDIAMAGRPRAQPHKACPWLPTHTRLRCCGRAGPPSHRNAKLRVPLRARQSPPRTARHPGLAKTRAQWRK